jgi:hypothetical protein
MNCSEVQPLLDLMLDGALDAKDMAFALQHLKECHQCTEEWMECEEFRRLFKDQRDRVTVPPDLNARLLAALHTEEDSKPRAIFGQLRYKFMLAAVVITLAGVVALQVLPVQNVGNSASGAVTVSRLVDDFEGQKNVQNYHLSDLSANGESNPVLAQALGYEPKFLRLQSWQMEHSSVYDMSPAAKVARFDFAQPGSGQGMRMTCYQGMQGTIKADHGSLKSLADKQVSFGTKGVVNFALWSQNGRDYLIVTPMPMHALEDIVKNA